MGIIKDLFDVEPDFEVIAVMAMENKNILGDLHDGISLNNKDADLRFKCHKVLMIISNKKPKLLVPYWDFYVELLKSENSFHNMNGIYLITGLAQHVELKRFEEIFDTYFNLLYNRKVAVASHTALNSHKIVKAKPQLIYAVTEKLLNFENEGKFMAQKELVKAYIIEAFGYFYIKCDNKDEIMEFVRNQEESESPKAREAAHEFLKRYKG